MAQRVVAEQVSAFAFNGLRFLLAAGVLIPILHLDMKRNATTRDLDHKVRLGIIAAGVVLFCGATLQQVGLQFTSAGNAGFITGLYVVLVPLISAVIMRQLPHLINFVAAMIAIAGLFMLSTSGNFTIAPGDGFELGGAFLWAIHVIMIGSLARMAHPLQIAVGQNLVCGGLSLSVAVLETQFQPWSGLGESWWSIIFTGLLSIGIGYTLQIVAQKDTLPADAAVILSLEAVVAALSGWLFLNERLTTIQLVGCGLMLGAMILAQLRGLTYALNQRA